jgi:hypothetical protein
MSFPLASILFVLAQNIFKILLLSEAIEGSGFGTCRPNSVKEFPDGGRRAVGIYLLLPFRLNINEIFIKEP